MHSRVAGGYTGTKGVSMYVCVGVWYGGGGMRGVAMPSKSERQDGLRVARQQSPPRITHNSIQAPWSANSTPGCTFLMLQ